MRVLHVCAGNLFGGVERIVVECAASRRRCPAMTPSFAVCFDGRLADDLARAGVTSTRLGDVRVSRPHTVVRARRTLDRLLRAERPDVVVCHSSWTFGLAAPVVRASGIGLALWIHDRVTGRTWAERWARLTTPDLVVANSRFTASTISSMYSSVPAEVVYAPVPAHARPGPAQGPSGNDARQTLRRALGADEGTTAILMASRLAPWKGHHELIAALARLDRRCHVWLAGGPQRAEEETYLRSLEAAARDAGVSDRVRFLGERRDVDALMRAADIHCQPNTEPEPFGLAFVEALDAGLPVVTTATGGAREIVTKDCGVLVPPGDRAALVDALARLAADPAARRRLGASGPARARELCDPERQLGALASVLAVAAESRVPA